MLAFQSLDPIRRLKLEAQPLLPRSISTVERYVADFTGQPSAYLGDAKAKGNALIETVGFVGQRLAPPGNSNVAINWQKDSLPSTTPTTITGTTTPETGTGSLLNPPPTNPQTTPIKPVPTP